jgi:geranylgeranyl diphosphate synthase type I
MAAGSDPAAPVEARLAQLLDAERSRWATIDADLAEPFRSLESLVLGGGKRLRPVFCHWAYLGAGGGDTALIVDVGAGLELLHAFALLHDDVMDGSDRRRGRPSAHRAYADRHAEANWRGEGRRFGEGVAILLGDLAAVYADRLLERAPPRARSVWDELRLEVNVGQYLDVLATARGDADVATARRINHYKSARYTVERPLHLGAALAGRDDLDEALSAYGLPLGEAFQLRDDLLGAFGDPARTGKPVGDDLRVGKPTPLLARARERADDASRRLLARAGAATITDDEVAAMQAVLRQTGADEQVEAEVVRLADEARAAAALLPITAPARDALARLVDVVAFRDS